MSFQDFFESFPNPFGTNKVRCESDRVDMDDPAFAQLDPHLHYDQLDTPGEGEVVPPFQRKSLRKPPSFDQMMNPIKSLTKKFEHIKGFRFEIGGAPTPNFHMTHAWNLLSGPPPQTPMGKGQIGTYTLSCQYVGGNIDPFNPIPQQPKVILTGRLDSAGKLEAVMIKPFDEKTQLRVSAMFPTTDMNYSMLHADLDVEGEDYTHTFKWGTNMWGFNFMQTIGQRLVLGFELMNLSDRKQSLLSGAMKYSWKKHSLYCQYHQLAGNFSLAYMQRVNKNAQLISEISMNLQDQETKTILVKDKYQFEKQAYRQKFNTTEVIATLNSKGKISSIINLTSGFFQLKLCASADYSKDNYKFGYGITLGQPQ